MIATEQETRTLLVSWTTSRARDTYGYNICRLDDTTTSKRYRCMGGGYDMVGTVFGDWLQDIAQDQLRAIGAQAAYYLPDRTTRPDGLYGMYYRPDGSVSLDGGCGLESMRRIAEAVGVTVRAIVQRGRTVGFTVTGVTV